MDNPSPEIDVFSQFRPKNIPLDDEDEDVDVFSQYRPVESDKKERPSYGERFKEGLNESTSGQFSKAVDKLRTTDYKNPEKLKEDPTFWESIVQSSGELAGDLPYFAAGATLGGTVGSLLGPVGALAGGAVGGFAFNEFLKESMKQYHDFQDKGGDLTFGEFLERADKVANKTLQSGALGLMLGAVQKSIPLLKATPIGKMFDTKYIGKPIEKATGLAGEVLTGTVIPAATEGRLPTSEDIAKATVLFAGPKIAERIPAGISKTKEVVSQIPAQLQHVMDVKKYGPINTAIAEQIENTNLAYPSLYELKQDYEQLNKNSVDLDRNISAFDKSYIDQFIGRIDNISSENLQSSREAGLKIYNTLFGSTPETKPEAKKISAIEKAGIQVQPMEPSQNNLKGRVGEAPTSGETLQTLEAEKDLFPSNKKAAPPNTPQVSEESKPIPKPVKSNVPLSEKDNPIRQGVNTISKRTFKNDVDAGEQISKVFHEIRDKQYEDFEKRYKTQGEAASGIVVTDKDLANDVRDFVLEYDLSVAPNSPESQVISKAKQVLFSVANIAGDGSVSGNKAISIQKLIKTNQSLKKIPNWNLPGDFKKVLGKLIDKIDTVIEGHLKQNNPELAKEFRLLNKNYRTFKENFDNSSTKILFDPVEKSQSIYKKFSNIDNFKQISEALNSSPEGQDVLNTLRRDVWEQKVGEGALKAKTEGDFADSLSKMSEREFSNLMEYLTPEQRVILNDRVQKINQIRESVNEAEKRFIESKENYERAVEQRRKDKVSKSRNERTNKEQQKIDKETLSEIERLEKIKEQERRHYEKIRENLKNNRVSDLRKKVDDQKDLLVSLLKQDPAEITKNMHTEEGIIRLKELSKGVENGDQMFSAVSRYETDQMFDFVRKGFAETGRVPYSKIKSKMSEKDFRAKLKAMHGENFVKSIDELVSTTDQLSRTFKEKQLKYINDPSVYNSMIDIATVLGLATGDISFPILINVGKKYGIKKAETWWKKDNYTQEGIKKAVDAARALKNGDKEQIKKTAKNLNS